MRFTSPIAGDSRSSARRLLDDLGILVALARPAFDVPTAVLGAPDLPAFDSSFFHCFKSRQVDCRDCHAAAPAALPFRLEAQSLAEQLGQLLVGVPLSARKAEFLPFETECTRFADTGAARDLIRRATGEALGRAIDGAELEPCVLKRSDGLGEPLVRYSDRVTVQLDVSAKLFAAAAP